MPTNQTSRWRVALVIAVGAACAYCSGVDQRRPHTSVSVGGGAAQAYHRTFGCHGELTHHEAQRLVSGAVEVDHESESGLLLGAAAVVQQATVQEVSATNRPPQTQSTGETQYFNNALHLRAGWTLGWGALAVGGNALPDLKTVFPYLRLRLGALNQGVAGELQVGGATRPIDPVIVGAGVRLAGDGYSLRVLAATIGRPLRSHQNVAGVFVPERTVTGSFFNGGDPAAVATFEMRIDNAISVRLDAVGAVAWGATVWLVWNSEPERKAKSRWEAAPEPPAVPLPGAVTGTHPPVPEPVPQGGP